MAKSANMAAFSKFVLSKFLACFFVFSVFGEFSAYAYTVTYNCGYYTGTAPSNDSATSNTSFTPPSLASNCNVMSGATLIGWAVSETEDIKTPGDSFTWEYDEDKTLSAVWSCYPDIDNTACVQGYKITLKNLVQSWDIPPTPPVLYTIQTRGAYLDAQRTLLMTTTDNPLGAPYREIRASYDTNAPINPITGNQYPMSNVEDTVSQVYWACFESVYGTCGVADTGFITSDGMDAAANLSANASWNVRGSHIGSSYLRPKPVLTGYSCDGWYGEDGELYSSLWFSTPSMLYAHWTPRTYAIQYVLNGGVHGGDHPESATYDSEFTVSDPTRTGYTFAGWTITGMDGVTHYYSADQIIANGVYQSSTTQTTTNMYLSGITQTHFMNLRSMTGTVTFNAQWIQDTYTLTYVVSNAPSGVSIPSAETVTPGAHNLQNVPTATGYTCSAWSCVTNPGGEDVPVNSNSISMPTSNVNCTSTCATNVVGLVWDTNGADNDADVQSNSPISCVYGTVNGINDIQTPVKQGYTFTGWVVRDWNNTLL